MPRALIAAVRHDVPVPPPEVDITEETEAFAEQMEGDEEGVAAQQMEAMRGKRFLQKDRMNKHGIEWCWRDGGVWDVW